MRYADARLVDHLARAYVRGTLAAGARRRFERLRQDRADVNLAVAEWEARLGPRVTVVQPISPPPRVWDAIEAQTGPDATGGLSAHSPGSPRDGWSGKD